MFFIYQLIITLLLLISPLIIIIRVLKNKEDKYRFIEKFTFQTKKKLSQDLIWFHGASVGEILSIIPLIKYYEKKKICSTNIDYIQHFKFFECFKKIQI